MEEDGLEATPRSGRTKKKSALARLAANRGKRKSNEGEDEKEARYPIDAKVEIQEHGQKEDDSDEGIEMASGSYDAGKRRISATALDGLKDLNMESDKNQHNNREDDESNSKKGAKRVLDPDSSSNDEANNSASRKASKQKILSSQMSDDDSDDDDDNDNLLEIRRGYKERYYKKNSRSPMLGSREDIHKMYADHLQNDLNESQNSNDSEEESDEKHDTMGPFPQPGSSMRGPRRHNNNSSSLFQRSILNSLESQWPGLDSSATMDVASQISTQSTSVLPLISTKAAKSRSYLFGTINSSSALLGSEELDRYFPERKVRVFVGSWNMCEMKDVPENIDEFLLPDSAEHVQDIYVIGTQESSSSRKEWEIKIQETLGPQHVLFHSAVHGTLGLVIFIRRDLIWFCSVSEEANVTTRPGSNIKTKGAVAVCFTFFGTSFLFVTSHFTAHDNKTQERIADYHKIVKLLNLPKIVQAKRYNPKNDVTTLFDRVFWCGDLNFRIETDREHVNTLVESIIDQEFPDYDVLLGHDQLTQSILQGLIFNEFQEGKIAFKPTYKYDKGTDTYDTKKLRIPSYTDRVLFRSLHKNAVTCLFYDSVMQQKESDHKPVYGLFEVNIRSGRDNIPLSGGQFNRDVWLEGCSRRSQKQLKSKEQKASTICSIQ